LLGGKKRSIGLGTLTKGKSAITSATGAFKQGKDVGIVEEQIASIQKEIATLQQQTEDEVAQITANFDPAAVKLETVTLKPAKTDVKVTSVALLWLPFDERGNPAW
jgi:phage host-nuclease inhibitor protein Gam